MATIRSQSQNENTKAREFFVPSLAGSTLLLLLGAILLAAYNFSQIIHWVGINYLNSTDTLHVNIGVLTHGFAKSFDSTFGGRLGQIIVWSLVGALCYILIWFLKNILFSFENDIIVDHYLHPKNYSRAGYWGSALAGIIFFAAVTITLLAYTFLCLMAVLPGASALANSAINDFKIPDSLLYLIVAVLVPAMAIYIWTLLIKAVTHLWKSI